MPATRLSPLDDSFLALESPTAHMHVGWAAVFDPPSGAPRPRFPELRRHIESRLSRAPRYRQKISPAPLSLDVPSWIDDEEFEIGHHVMPAQSADIDEVVDDCMSRQLDRDRPLWEVRIADRLPDGRIGVVGKAHHCMVDGVAAVELASLLLDPSPDAGQEPSQDWRPGRPPGTVARLVGGAGEKLKGPIALARFGTELLRSPGRLANAPKQAVDAWGALSRGLRPAHPVHPLNEPISSERRIARVERSLTELQEVKRRFGMTLNDVYLAVAAGAVRRLLIEHDQDPVPVKTMVPVSVREDGELEELGNRISFMFLDLPCDEQDPKRRLHRVQLAASRCKEGGDSRAGDAVMRAVGYAPRAVQRLVSRMAASPRMFNLVVSNIPGPPEPMFMRGCELKEAYPIVPLADRHAVSIGMTTIQDRACFGLYGDGSHVRDLRKLAVALERSTDELLRV